MNNKHIISSGEINLTELFKVIWNGKIKIALITLIIFLIISVNNKYKPKQPDSFKNSLVINPAKGKEFLSFLPVYSYLNESYLNENRPNKIEQIERLDILEKFIMEFLDYEELIYVLANNKNIKKNISQLSKNDRQQKLYNYAKVFNVEKQNERLPNYIIKFTWQNNNKEIINMLDQALKLTSINIKKSIFSELESHYQRKKDLTINRDLSRIAYLTEQSLIAKELNIEDGGSSYVNFGYTDDSWVKVNSTSNMPYYLRGFKAINIEIELIKNRKYPQLNNIEKQINLLEKKDIKWVDYNIFLLDTELMNKKNTTLSSLASIVLSLLIGVFYVLISNNFQPYKVTRKK
jgi:LPS O-antigen subunit length determinant protein (WzzB/FepE family)